MNAPKLTGNRCQCTACDECFSSIRSFDKHRIGAYDRNRRCLSVEELHAHGCRKNERGFWLEPCPEHAPAALAGNFAPPARVRPHPTTRVPDWLGAP